MGPFGRPGRIDPLTLLAFQNGGLGGSGGDDNLLPLLLLGGGGLGSHSSHPGRGGLGGGINPLQLLAFQKGGLGGHPGKGGLGGLNPLLLSGLLGCKETSGDDCIVPNNDNGDLCGKKIGETLCCVCKKP